MTTVNAIITAASLITAIAVICKYYNKAYKLIMHDAEQDKKIEEIEARHKADEKKTNEELCLVIYGVQACLKGLKEQGCNGPVTEAINKIDKHLNQAAHDLDDD